VEEFGVHVDGVWWVMLKVETCFGSFDVCSTSLFYLMTYFKNILSFPLFGSLSRREWKGMERPFPCLGV
jgi:hypothetical protein